MKKILSTIFICAAILSIAGCGSVNNSELEALKQENQELKKQLEEMSKDSAQLDISSTGEHELEDNRGLEPIVMGQTVEVQTDFGNFEIQIDDISNISMFTGEPAIAIKCIVNNISFSVSGYDEGVVTGKLIADDNNILQLTDRNGVAFPFYNLDAQIGEYALDHKVSIGSKGREAYAFLVSKDIQDVSVVINNQYILNADIKYN